MTHEEFEKQCWNYYLILERNFLRSVQYIYLDEANYPTFSLDYVNQLLSICSEVENTVKIISQGECGDKFFPSFKKTLTILPGLKHSRVHLLYFSSIILTPFENIDEQSEINIDWWNAYNAVKHHKIDNIKNANMKNVLQSLSALFILNIHGLKYFARDDEKDSPQIESQLFVDKDFMWNFINMSQCSYKVELLDIRT